MSNDVPYEVEDFELVEQVPNLRVVVFTLAAGQCVPWHIHTQITDKFFCLEGPMTVEHRGELATAELNVGDSYVVTPNTPHRVSGKEGGRCRFLLVQGIGTYDFIPLGDD